jgi:type II secretory pathway component GspD/PulD (secretin)
MQHTRWRGLVLVVGSCVALGARAAAQDAPMQAQGAAVQAPTATQPAEPAAPPVQPATAPAAPTPPPALPAAQIRFNFKGASFDQVLDFFSRITGLPVVKETDVPDGTLDYLSPKAYELPEALRVLNMLLQTRGVMLRVSRDNLFLQKLDQMQKEDIPTFIGTLPEQVTSDQIVTVVYPMRIALAKPMAEKLATMVAAYGSVAALEQQNSLIITETAANVRRILSIIETLDREDPEGVVEVFPIRHAKAKDLMTSLTALLATKVEKFVVNEKGQQIKIEENQMPGLAISPDERTNSIIAKGVQNRMDKLRQTIALLDVPSSASAGGRSMTTVALSRMTPADAVAKLNLLYARIEEKSRPVVVALDDAAKVMIIGDDQAIAEGSMLIAEMENGPVGTHSQEPGISVIALENGNPGAVANAVNSLLNKRQLASMKVLPGLDGRSLIISGTQADVDQVKSLAPILDRQAASDRQVRLVRIATGDPAQVLDRARALYHQQAQPDDPRATISAVLDADSRVATLIGSAKAIDALTSLLRQVESTVVIEREARRIALSHKLPSEVIGPLTALATPLLAPRDPGQFIPPAFAPIDQLKTLVVTATPEQFAVIEPLITSLDEPGEGRPLVRVRPLTFADAATVSNSINAALPGLVSKTTGRPLSVRLIPAAGSNAIMLTGLRPIWPRSRR